MYNMNRETILFLGFPSPYKFYLQENYRSRYAAEWLRCGLTSDDNKQNASFLRGVRGIRILSDIEVVPVDS